MALSARSTQRFPSLAPPSCGWHDDCTPMDCENFRAVPDYLSKYQRAQETAEQAEERSVKRAQQALRSVPNKPSKHKR